VAWCNLLALTAVPSGLTRWIGAQIESEASRRERTRAHVTELKAQCDRALADQHAQGKVMPPTIDTRKWARANTGQLGLGTQTADAVAAA
jgi:hypothetical protein